MVTKTRPAVLDVVPAPTLGRTTATVRSTPTGNAHGGMVNRGVAPVVGVRRGYNLSPMVSNVVKVLPVFYSDTATVEKGREFWELFEAHTEHLPDQSRLLVSRQKIKGRPAERWL
ncbi:unnamed protein product [Phytophthora fragariaefolia]|uniref:Unnamed protein product n=1 Tax=Phytophthora fragariaefolia TaxID=1490495 RepID=A0A9W6YN58_9STRA|nr:unnamed protein product [Phytophthora fragariaefolia]